jgi:hypothetical protein
MRLPLAVLAVLLLPGCSMPGGSGGPEGFSQVTVRLHNQGETTMAVPFSATADGRSLLAETLSVPGGGTVERSVAAVPGASYVLHAKYEAVRTEGSNTQGVRGARTHTLEWDDCPAGTVVVTFTFRYTASRERHSFSQGTSAGQCVP